MMLIRILQTCSIKTIRVSNTSERTEDGALKMGIEEDTIRLKRGKHIRNVDYVSSNINDTVDVHLIDGLILTNIPENVLGERVPQETGKGHPKGTELRHSRNCCNAH